MASAQGLIVPHSAVLPEGRGHSLFTIKDNRAVKHLVQVGLRNDKEVEIKGAGLQAGESVVVLGNYELKNGMAVKVEAAP